MVGIRQALMLAITNKTSLRVGGIDVESLDAVHGLDVVSTPS